MIFPCCVLHTRVSDIAANGNRLPSGRHVIVSLREKTGKKTGIVRSCAIAECVREVVRQWDCTVYVNYGEASDLSSADRRSREGTLLAYVWSTAWHLIAHRDICEHKMQNQVLRRTHNFCCTDKLQLMTYSHTTRSLSAVGRHVFLVLHFSQTSKRNDTILLEDSTLSTLAAIHPCFVCSHFSSACLQERPPL